MVRLGADRIVSRIAGNVGSILVFHRVRYDDGCFRFQTNLRSCITPEHFETVLHTLRKAGLDIVSLDEAMLRLGEARPGRFVCLTFDDGYEDNLRLALPIARAFDAPVTIYITPGLLDGTTALWWYAIDDVVSRNTSVRLPVPEEKEFLASSDVEKREAFEQIVSYLLTATPEEVERVVAMAIERYAFDPKSTAARHMLDWDAVRRLAATPGVTLGAHTMGHPNLTRLAPTEVEREMTECRDRIAAEARVTVRHFAYPFGNRQAVGSREVELAERVGYSTAVTTLPGNLYPEHLRYRFALPRHGIGRSDGSATVRLKLAGLTRDPRRVLQPVVTVRK